MGLRSQLKTMKSKRKSRDLAAPKEMQILRRLLRAWVVDGQGRKQGQVWWSHYEQGPFLPQHLGFFL